MSSYAPRMPTDLGSCYIMIAEQAKKINDHEKEMKYLRDEISNSLQIIRGYAETQQPMTHIKTDLVVRRTRMVNTCGKGKSKRVS